MIQLLRTLATDDADVLQTAGSQLRRAPADGEYRLYAISDQADGLLSINVGGVQVVESSNMLVTTVSQLKIEGPPLFRFLVRKGVDVVINYNEVTAGTATVLIIFLDLVDLMFEKGKTPRQTALAISGQL